MEEDSSMIPSDILEKIFTYNGYVCLIMFQVYGYRTAYVGIPKGHTMYNMTFNRINDVINCHGGITYKGSDIFQLEPPHDKMTWVGWDYGHELDLADEVSAKKYYGDGLGLVHSYNEMKKITLFPRIDTIVTRKFYTKDEVMEDCKSVVDQIITYLKENTDNTEEITISLDDILDDSNNMFTIEITSED